MSSFINQLQWLVTLSKTNFHWVLIVLISLWAIQLINWVLRYHLNVLGILPRTVPGLLGIIFSPLLHGSFTHLLFNSIPLFILLNFLLLTGLTNTIATTLLITVLSGFGVWLVGRKALHIGASGIILGYWGYLLVDAVLYPSVVTIFLVIICLYYFGGFLGSLLPKQGSSWESHVFGFLAGLSTSYFHLSDYLVPYLIHLT